MSSYTKNGNVLFLIKTMLLFLAGSSYSYAQLTTSNVCPNTTVDLTTHVSGTPPVGTVVTWHTGTPATPANQVADPTKVGAGIYYAAYFDVATSCFGNTTGSLTVTINTCAPVNNICPSTTVDLTTHISGTPPVGTVVTWHTGTPATLANQVADPTKVSTGVYYAAFSDTATNCYGNTTIPLSVSIILCPAPLPDKGSVIVGVGGTAVGNVTANDLMSGQPASLGAGGNAAITSVGTYPTGIALNTTSGAITVSASVAPGIYTVTYQLCNLVSTPTCATTTVTVTVNPNVTAATDAGAVSTGTGGVAIVNVTSNDVVNGTPASLGGGGNATLASVGTYPTGITLNTATGSVSVAQGTTPGSYTIAYQLCDKLTPVTCNTATATITVTPSVTASPDAGTVSAGTGGLAVTNVRTNDAVNGLAANGANSILSVVGTYPTGITLNTTAGSVSVAQGTTPGSYTLVYQLCDLLTPTTCTTTTATITVTPSVTATPDAGTVSAGAGGTAVVNVRANDVINGIAASGANSVLSVVGTYPAGITLNTTTGSVSVAQGTTPGSYTLVYQLCDLLTPASCATTTAAITVTPSVIASPDAGTVSTGVDGVAVTNVRANDVVNGIAASGVNSVLSVVGTYPAGITLNTTTGSLSVAQGTIPGSYTIAYQLCDKLTPTTCTTAVALVTVIQSVTAAPDSGTASAGTGGVAVANVRANDVVNGLPATAANSVLTTLGTYPTGITLNTTTGSVSIAQGITPGSYTLVYQLCDLLTPASCGTATVAITITPSVTATPDAGTVSAGTGGIAVINVRANDLVNGIFASAANSTLSVVGTYPTGISLNTDTGSLSVDQGTTPDSYTIAYQLCDLLTPATCTTTVATITVTTSVTVSPDAGSVGAAGGGIAVANVVANDLVNGQSVTVGAGGNAVLAELGTYPVGITLNTTTGSVSVAQGTAPGNYTIAYQLCNKLTPATCSTAIVTVAVVAGSVATADNGSVPATGGIAVANVATNDVVNGQSATLGAGGNATVSSIGTYPAGITLNTTGSVSVAQGTSPGSYTLAYQLCDKLSTPTCNTGLVVISVTPIVPASPDAGTANAGNGGVAVSNVVANDVVNGLPATLGTGGNATIAALGAYPTGISLNPATGALSVAPGTSPGSFTLAYQLCDKLSIPTCTTTTLQLTVGTSLTAIPDAVTLVGGSALTIPILANDKNPNGSSITDLTQVSLPLVSTPLKGQLVVNPDGSVSYSANIGSSGLEVLTYTICDKLNPGQCSSTTLTISISANLSVALAPKVYLQGPLFGVASGNPLMRDDLRVKGYVPLSSPYGLLGMNGLTPVGPTTSGVLSVTGASAVVDWVFVELRSPTSNTLVVDSRAGLLLRSGEIVEVDGVSSLSFSAVQRGSYYVAVRHRNHLGVMTAQAIALSYSAVAVDFRRPATLTYNRDTSNVINQAQVVVDQGVALWAGNALVDREVIFQGPGNDVSVLSQQVINWSGNILSSPSYKLRGYYTGDVNLNGEVIFQGRGNDVDFIYQNVLNNHPGNSSKANFFKIREQLP